MVFTSAKSRLMMPGNGDDVGDALHRLAQNVVGDAERLEEARVLGDRQQLFVGDDDGGVHRVDQLLQAALRLVLAALAFEGERLGDHRDRERAHFAGQRRDDRRRARAGAATKTGGDEDHVRAFERFDDFVGIFQRSLAANVGIGARAQAIGQLDAKLDLHRRVRQLERLKIGVRHHEFHAFQVRLDHAIDGIAATAADANDLDLRGVQQLFVEVNANVVFGLALVVEIFDHLYSPMRRRDGAGQLQS